MKFPSIFSRQKSETTPEKSAIAQKLATIEGCDNLLAEHRAQHDAAENFATKAHIAKQIEQIERAAFQLKLDEQRKAVAATTDRDLEDARQSVKGCEEALQVAAEAAHNAELQVAAMQARIQPMEAQLAQDRRDAEQRLISAQARFELVMNSSEPSDAEELAASKDVFNARRDFEDVSSNGCLLALRIGALAAQLVKLKASADEALAARDMAAIELKKARAQVLLVEYDRQGQKLIDSYLAVFVALRDAGGRPKGFQGVDCPMVQFSKVGHVIFGDRLDGSYGNCLPAFQIQNIGLNSREVQLDLLLQQPPADTEPEAVSDAEGVGGSV